MSVPSRPPGAGLAGGGLWPAHVPRPQPPSPDVGPPADGRATAPVPTQEELVRRLPWHGVSWTLVYVGFLGYVFAMTTYRLPIGDVSMVVALVGLLTQREQFRLPGILKGLAVFLLWCVVGYAVTTQPEQVWQRLEVVLKLWLIALVAANALRSREQIRFFVVFWLGCFALYPVRGALFNYYVYGETVVGRASWNYIFSNPNDLAAYCLLQLALAIGLLALERRGPVRFATIAGMTVLPLLILLTRSRGAFLGFAGFILLVLSGQRKRGRAVAITVMLAAIVTTIAPDDVLDRVLGLGNVQGTENLQQADVEGSAYQRYEIWKVARTMIREQPVVGVGLGAYPLVHALYARRPQFDPTARGRRDTHSTYLNLAAETGLVGMVIYFASYLSALIYIDRVRRRARLLLPKTAQTLFVFEAGTIAFFICAIFGSMAHVSFLILQVIVSWSVADLADRELKSLRTGAPVGASGGRFAHQRSS